MNRKIKQFFYVCKYATSMMNLMTIVIMSLVVAAIAVNLFQSAFLYWTTSMVLLTVIAIFCLLVIAYAIGTIVYSIFVYMKMI